MLLRANNVIESHPCQLVYDVAIHCLTIEALNKIHFGLLKVAFGSFNEGHTLDACNNKNKGPTKTKVTTLHVHVGRVCRCVVFFVTRFLFSLLFRLVYIYLQVVTMVTCFQSVVARDIDKIDIRMIYIKILYFYVNHC